MCERTLATRAGTSTCTCYACVRECLRGVMCRAHMSVRARDVLCVTDSETVAVHIVHMCTLMHCHTVQYEVQRGAFCFSNLKLWQKVRAQSLHEGCIFFITATFLGGGHSVDGFHGSRL